MAPERRFDPVTSTLTVRIPMRFVVHKGTKRIVTPDDHGGEAMTDLRAGPEPALLTALAKAWRWQRMLDSGQYGSLADLAAAEKVNASTFSRTLRLLSLSPQIIDAILDGTAPAGVEFHHLREGIPHIWADQLPALNRIR